MAHIVLVRILKADSLGDCPDSAMEDGARPAINGMQVCECTKAYVKAKFSKEEIIRFLGDFKNAKNKHDFLASGPFHSQGKPTVYEQAHAFYVIDSSQTKYGTNRLTKI